MNGDITLEARWLAKCC